MAMRPGVRGAALLGRAVRQLASHGLEHRVAAKLRISVSTVSGERAHGRAEKLGQQQRARAASAR
jgi:hypothetical protein